MILAPWIAVSLAFGLGQEDFLKTAGVSEGLVVRLGTTDGALEMDLGRSGRVLVHGLALSEKALLLARQNLQAKGVQGLITVERAVSLDPLPYADNLVNLLVADGSLPGFSMKEVLRVLAPKGVACIRENDAWTKTVKPRPKEMDDWTHFDYGPEGNGVALGERLGAGRLDPPARDAPLSMTC